MDIWVVGAAISGGQFTNAACEAVADYFEWISVGGSHTVTRVDGSGWAGDGSDRPLTTDCDVAVIVGEPFPSYGSWPYDDVKALGTDCAPMMHLNAYLGDACGLWASVGGNATSDTFNVRNVSTVTWTDGHSVGDDVDVGTARYSDFPATLQSGAIALLRIGGIGGTNNVYAWDDGTTLNGNMGASGTTTARVVMMSTYSGIESFDSSEGQQLVNDVLTWLQGDAPAQDIAATGLDASTSFGTPTLTPGTYSQAIDNFTASASFGDPGIESEVIVNASGLDASATLGGPVVDTLGTLSPFGFNPTVFGTFELLWDQPAAPTGLATPASFGTPLPVPDQIIVPAGVDTGASIGATGFDLNAERTAGAFNASPGFGVVDLGGVPTAGWQLFVRTRGTVDAVAADHQLFNWVDLKIHDPLNEVGVGQFSIPLSAPDFIAARATLMNEADVIVDCYFDGVRRFRMLVESDELVELQGDDGARLVATFSGRSFAAELGSIITLPAGYPTSTSEVRETTGAGPQAWAVIIEQGKSLGAGSLLGVNFGAADSNGTPWPSSTDVDARINVGTTALDAASSLLIPGEVEWKVNGDGDLVAAPSLGTNKTNAVRFRVGAHQLDRVRRRSKRNIVNQVLVLGPDGTIEAVDDPASVASYGGRQTLVRAATTNVSDRQAIAQAIATSKGQLIESVQVRVDPWQIGAALWTDWGLGDTVSVDVEGLAAADLGLALEVSAITIQSDGVETAVEVTLGTDSEIAADVWSRRIERVINEQAVGLQQGGGSVTDQLGVAYSHDNVNPTGLSVVNRGGAAVNESAINVSWTAPTGDGSGSVAAYEVALADPVVFAFGVARQRLRTSTTNQAVFGLIPNTEYTVDVYALNPLGERIGQVTTTYTTPVDTTVPAQVQGLAVIGSFNALRAVWSENSEPDVANNRGAYRVQVDTDSGFGSPDIDETVGATILNLTGFSGGTFAYVRVAAIDSSGNQGAWSETRSSSAGLITSSDITDGTITGGDIGGGTITGGNIGGGTITGGNIGSGTVSGGNIGYQTVTGGNIGLGTVGGSNIGGGTISGSNIGSGAVGGSNIGWGAVQGGGGANHISAGTIIATDIAAYTITADRIGAGQITANMITAGTMSADRINGGAISGTSINLGAFNVTSGGAVTATSYSLTGGTLTSPSINSATISGGSINIGSGGFVVDGSGNMTIGGARSITWSGSNTVRMYGDTGSGSLVVSDPIVCLSSITLTGSILASATLNGSGGTVSGSWNVNGFLNNTGHPTGSFAINGNVATDGTGRIRRNTSSIRYKTDVVGRAGSARATRRTAAEAIAGDVVEAKTVLSLDPVWYTPTETDRPGRWSGFIAEDAHDLGLVHLVEYDGDGEPEAIDYARVSVDHHVVLQNHEDRLDALEAALAATGRGRKL